MKGHIRKRGQSWTIVLDIGPDASGKRRQKWIPVHGSKREAEAELARLLTERQQGTFTEPSKRTVAEYLDYWLTHYARAAVAAKTYDGYEEYVRLYLVPHLGHFRLDRLQPAHIQACYSALLSQERTRGRGMLSARTVLHAHRVLRHAFAQAVRWQFLGRNPADLVAPPKPRVTEQAVLSVAEMATVLQAARRSTLYLPILIALTTGLRRGEILGLRWSDVDVAQGVLSVRQSLSQPKAGMYFKAPKTRQSRRVVVLPALLVSALQAHRAAQVEAQQLLGSAYQNLDLVVAEANGQPRSPRALSAAFADLIARLPVPRVRFHDLRHSHATLLLQEQVHPKVVSERLGHSTVKLTLDTYSHVLPSMQAAASRQIDAALRGALNGDITEEP